MSALKKRGGWDFRPEHVEPLPEGSDTQAFFLNGWTFYARPGSLMVIEDTSGRGIALTAEQCVDLVAAIADLVPREQPRPLRPEIP